MLADESIGDAVFQAGVDVLEAVGLYHLGTHRVIKFTKEEILELARELAETIMDSIDELVGKEIPRENLCTFKEIYDLESIEPKPDYRSTLDRAREQLIRLGAPLK
jgi:hypothetical protein